MSTFVFSVFFYILPRSGVKLRIPTCTCVFLRRVTISYFLRSFINDIFGLITNEYHPPFLLTLTIPYKPPQTEPLKNVSN